MAFDRLTLDLFKSAKISRNELDLFTSDFLKRVQVKGTDLIPQAQTDLITTAYKNFKTNLGLQANKGALQKGGTLTRKEAFESVIKFIRREEGLIKSKFGKPSAAYLEFFPQGLTEYSQSKVEGLTNLLVRFVAAAEKHKLALGQDFLTEITELQITYTNARDDQGTSIAVNKNVQSEVRDTRKILTLQLTKVVLLVAANTIENAELFNSYFNFGLLQIDNDNPSDPIEPKG